MSGRRRREQPELFAAGSLEQLIPEDNDLFRATAIRYSHTVTFLDLDCL